MQLDRIKNVLSQQLILEGGVNFSVLSFGELEWGCGGEGKGKPEGTVPKMAQKLQQFFNRIMLLGLES